MLEGSPDAEILLLEKTQNRRVGVATLIRRFKKKTYPTPEYTGFVDFENFIFMCVLFTPENLVRKNLRKLRFILSDAFPMAITYNHAARIRDAETRLKEPLSIEERAQLLAKIGFWYREMRDLQNSKRAIDESLSLIPNQDYAQTQLRMTLTKIGDRDAMLEAMGRLVRLDPHNPRVFDDCIAYTKGGPMTNSDVLSVLEDLRSEYSEDQLVHANCDFYAGKVLAEADPVSARKYLTAAQAAFRKLFPRGHPVFTALRSALRVLNQTK